MGTVENAAVEAAVSAAAPAFKAAVSAQALPYLRAYAGPNLARQIRRRAMGAGDDAFAAVIVGGREPHAILLDLFTDGAGTLTRGG